jgi:Dolichyl-phosphate-mannose-protein mannosyltransferase
VKLRVGRDRPRSLTTPSIVLASVCFLLHLVVNTRYDVFRDELYFIVCGQHPALGYVDQPPLIPLIAGASHALFGTALLPLRLVPALAMSATVALAVELVRLLGGGRFAQWLCGLTVLLGPVFLANGLLLATDALQPLTWLVCNWCLVRLVQTNDERWWLGFGLSAGISLAGKYLIFLYLAGLAVGLLLTPLRRSLLKPWLYLGALVATIFLAPSVYWQAENGWPFLVLLRAGASGKNLVLPPLQFIGQQIAFVGVMSAPIWLAGLWRLSVHPRLVHLRVFAIAYAVMIAFLYAVHGKAYYLTPIYPVLLAAGALAIEGWLVRPAQRRMAVGVVAVAGGLAVPVVLPILPPGDWTSYAHALGMSSRTTATQTLDQGVLPQYLADMFGWREMADKVSAVYNALPPGERAEAVFFGRNYGEAAAIDVYGPALHGPPAISGHNNYYLWGTRGYDGSVLIMVGRDRVQLANLYRSVERAGEITNPYGVSFETHLSIYVLRGLRIPFTKLWPRLKHYE